MTQVGEGRGAGYEAGAPTGGEILAERYQLIQHVNTDRLGRQIWRGMDVILRRPVAVVIRYPGGTASTEMLQAAVGASRIVHPNLVGVYDAIDEHARAYVVREWVEGSSLRDHIQMGTLEAHHAIAVAHSCAEAVAAVHAAGMTHGNIHPGTVLIDPDGRVVLADAHADGATPHEEDIRAVGALLYFALTGYWPHAEVAGPTNLPDALRDADGAPAAPRQVRAGVPAHLDNLAMDLLDRHLAVPAADVVAGELGRLDASADSSYGSSYGPYGGASTSHQSGYASAAPQHRPEPELEISTGPIRLTTTADPPARPSGRKLALGLGGLLAAGVVGLLVGLTWLTGSPDTGGDGGPGAAPGNDGQVATGAPPEGAETAAPIALGANQVRVVDPPSGDRTELDGVELVVDDDPSTGWQTDKYNSAQFGNIKPGMGILMDLGEPRHVTSVQVQLATAGATAELRVGDEDPGSSSAGDEQIYQSFEPVGDQQSGEATLEFAVPESESGYQYLMIWFSDLAPEDGGFRVEVQQVAVEGY